MPFRSRAHADAARSNSVGRACLAVLARADTPAELLHTQLVRKFNHAQPDELQILLAVYRLQEQNVDLVLSMNVPMKTSDGATTTPGDFAAARETFSAAVESLRIENYGLFA